MNWVHTQCERCWFDHNPDRFPVRVMPQPGSLPKVEPCCFCHKPTISGIYVRRHPDSTELQCKETDIHKDD